ncbi:unnamed protein product [Onchocerca flexuosa]|uniref:C2H2-type domain-containing protein n=1 Tax=Onchocerca flexuosa TaxID=387005 RepID=A0A183H4R8_9BILA|nr:unnamed protein product [Onchocerca flexuosa]
MDNYQVAYLSKEAIIANYSMFANTIALGHIKTIDLLASNIACRRHFYGYGESYNFGNDQQLSCAICHSKVLKKFLEFHAWMHLSWVFQVGDRFPFQCTRCEFAAYRIPDVVCHTKEIHGNVDANLFVPTVPLGILQFYFNKVTECFPPMKYSLKLQICFENPQSSVSSNPFPKIWIKKCKRSDEKDIPSIIGYTCT